MKMPADYQVPDDPTSGVMDASYLRTIFGLRIGDDGVVPELPESVRRAHYDISRPLQIIGAVGVNMTADQLAMVSALAVRDGETIPETKVERSFLDETPKDGQKVVVKWSKKWRPGHFIAFKEGLVTVLIEGVERIIKPDLVRFPEEGEFPEVADNYKELTSSQ